MTKGLSTTKKKKKKVVKTVCFKAKKSGKQRGLIHSLFWSFHRSLYYFRRKETTKWETAGFDSLLQSLFDERVLFL